MNTKTNETHFYAACAYGWATAKTRELAIERVIKAFRHGLSRLTKKNQQSGDAPGAYIWTCEVHAPADAGYSINNFVPQGVEISGQREHYTTHVTQKNIAYWTDPSWSNAEKAGA